MFKFTSLFKAFSDPGPTERELDLVEDTLKNRVAQVLENEAQRSQRYEPAQNATNNYYKKQK
jgi:hypothetical protein